MVSHTSFGGVSLIVWREGVISRNPSKSVTTSLVVFTKRRLKTYAEMSPRHIRMLGTTPFSAIIIVVVIKGRECPLPMNGMN